MPLYDYECPKCGVFEHQQKLVDKNLEVCPTCSEKVIRLISAPVFQLIGSGWYKTDNIKGGKGGTKK